jgi:hypothetical protein
VKAVELQVDFCPVLELGDRFAEGRVAGEADAVRVETPPRASSAAAV